jgi:hypothetical protein
MESFIAIGWTRALADGSWYDGLGGCRDGYARLIVFEAHENACKILPSLTYVFPDSRKKFLKNLNLIEAPRSNCEKGTYGALDTYTPIKRAIKERA